MSQDQLTFDKGIHPLEIYPVILRYASVLEEVKLMETCVGYYLDHRLESLDNRLDKLEF